MTKNFEPGGKMQSGKTVKSKENGMKEYRHGHESNPWRKQGITEGNPPNKPAGHGPEN